MNKILKKCSYVVFLLMTAVIIGCGDGGHGGGTDDQETQEYADNQETQEYADNTTNAVVENSCDLKAALLDEFNEFCEETDAESDENSTEHTVLAGWDSVSYQADLSKELLCKNTFGTSSSSLEKIVFNLGYYCSGSSNLIKAPKSNKQTDANNWNYNSGYSFSYGPAMGNSNSDFSDGAYMDGSPSDDYSVESQSISSLNSLCLKVLEKIAMFESECK